MLGLLNISQIKIFQSDYKSALRGVNSLASQLSNEHNDSFRKNFRKVT